MSLDKFSEWRFVKNLHDKYYDNLYYHFVNRHLSPYTIDGVIEHRAERDDFGFRISDFGLRIEERRRAESWRLEERFALGWRQSQGLE